MEYHELNQLMNPAEAAVPDVVFSSMNKKGHWGNINSLVLCHNLLHKDHDHLLCLRIHTGHYIEHILLIGF